MSSRRYQEDIRRIVGLQDTLRGLDEEVPRMRIDGARGIFMIGSGETKSGAAPSEDEDGNKTAPVMPDENEDNQNEDGSGTGGSGTDPSGTDGDDLVIDPEDPGNYSPDDSTFGDGWGSSGVSTFQDCVDNTCIEIVGRGGYVPPEGWTDAETGPIDPYWESGYYWANGQNDPIKGRTPAEYCALRGYGTVTGWTGNPSAPACSETSNVKLIKWATSDPYFQDPPPPPDSWPSDNCIQLTPNGAGQWAASSYENPDDMTAKYSEAKSILDLCTPNGDGVQILPGADGGTVRWNYTQGRFMAISPDGKKSFGGATEITTAVAGSVKDGGAIKASGAAVPSS